MKKKKGVIRVFALLRNRIQKKVLLEECLKKVNSAYPFYVLITDKISNETEQFLHSCGIKTIRKKSIEIPVEIKEKNAQGDFSHWTYTFDKLSIFELTQFLEDFLTNLFKKIVNLIG